MSGAVVEISTTVPDREFGLELGRAAVEAGLAACAQVSGPITSIYTWKNELVEETEWRVHFKSFQRLSSDLEEFIRSRHPYEVPEIIVIDASAVSSDYLGWMTGAARQ